MCLWCFVGVLVCVSFGKWGEGSGFEWLFYWFDGWIGGRKGGYFVGYFGVCEWKCCRVYLGFFASKSRKIGGAN